MSFLTSWITNILLFILLAIVIDLLLPNSSMQKYAKMVIGLMLIVIILNPVFNLFSVDINKLISEFQINNLSQDEESKKLIESQKKEIQASQRAYILEQMAVQMKKDAGEDLEKSFHMNISSIDIHIQNGQEAIESSKDVQSVDVFLSTASQKQQPSVEAITPVRIDTSKELAPKEEIDKNRLEEMTVLLAKIWQLDQSQIQIHAEGGENQVHE
ncbi:stage III sporulation protein AF [Bacillus sp. FJAT-42376]|uniref:stage III sporulation protein AF n=1 Tax=Bacillus sp. FJAT-42376 TaxID=2014076 RepID=UPI000F4E9FC3|nr:stage III sporulation protein AF [Bacillus sp. FJAT-42376]AZB43535.1 stage III sporulation protein AF [Bacillus sp. FJAT-42376]